MHVQASNISLDLYAPGSRLVYMGAVTQDVSTQRLLRCLPAPAALTSSACCADLLRLLR